MASFSPRCMFTMLSDVAGVDLKIGTWRESALIPAAPFCHVVIRHTVLYLPLNLKYLLPDTCGRNYHRRTRADWDSKQN